MAVIGVSLSNDRHPGNVIYNKNHHRYPLQVFPVNPHGGVVQGQGPAVDRGQGADPIPDVDGPVSPAPAAVG